MVFENYLQFHGGQENQMCNLHLIAVHMSNFYVLLFHNYHSNHTLRAKNITYYIKITYKNIMKLKYELLNIKIFFKQ